MYNINHLFKKHKMIYNFFNLFVKCTILLSKIIYFKTSVAITNLNGLLQNFHIVIYYIRDIIYQDTIYNNVRNIRIMVDFM